MPTPDEFNPLAPETVENPFAFYAALRERAPVYQSPLGFYIVSRYRDAVYVLNHEEIFSSRQPPGVEAQIDPEIAQVVQRGYPQIDTLLTNDPPSHTRYRALITKAFSARRVASLEPTIRAIANQLIDRFVNDRKVELMGGFAVPLPLTVIADALGVDRGDLDRFKRWSDDSVAPLGGMIGRERKLECARSVVELQNYFAARIEERRKFPRDDLLTDLVNARLEGVAALTVPEMLSMIQQLLVAGNETTTNLIGSGMMLLVHHPKEMAAVIEDRALIPNMVEEALRMESPVQGLFRVALQDCELAGVRIPRGARVAVMYASANRDEAQFPQADQFDVRRANARTHLAFGQGVHFCIGAALARLEARIAFETLLARLRNVRFASGNDFRHSPSFILRGLNALHLEFARC